MADGTTNWTLLGSKEIDVTVVTPTVKQPTVELSLNKTTVHPDDTVTVTVKLTNNEPNYDLTNGEILVYINVNNALGTIADFKDLTVPKGGSITKKATFKVSDFMYDPTTDKYFTSATVYALAGGKIDDHTFDSIKSKVIPLTLKFYTIMVSKDFSLGLLVNGKQFSGGDITTDDDIGAVVTYNVAPYNGKEPSQGSVKAEIIVTNTDSEQEVFNNSKVKAYNLIKSTKKDSVSLDIGKLSPGNYKVKTNLYVTDQVIGG